jgi:hypothetical protein
VTTWNDLATQVAAIVADATALKDGHTDAATARVSYCAIFCQSQDQYAEAKAAAMQIGTVADETPTGPVFVVPEIDTFAGPLRIVKIRVPDETRKERGDADFALADYETFKKRFLGSKGFKLIERDDFEMIELVDDAFDVRAYFSHPPVEEHSGIRQTLASLPAQ